MKFTVKDVWCADFETTGYEQYLKTGETHVWLWSLVSCDLYFKLHGTKIDDFITRLHEFGIRRLFFFNLRFDASFLVDRFLRMGWTNGQEFDCIIDGMNIWYSVRIYWNPDDRSDYTEIFDAAKKFPGMNLEGVAEMYDIQGKTLNGEHKKEVFAKFRDDDYKPTDEEIEYCVNDSVICASAIASEIANKHVGMTLSADAFKDVRQMLNRTIDPKNAYPTAWRKVMPAISKEWDDWLRRAYRGGYVMCSDEWKEEELEGVKVFDVNSLYPFVMESCRLPVGHPYWKEKPRADELYVIEIDCMWKLRKGKLPMLQIKDDPRYDPLVYTEHDEGPTTLVMTNIDWKLFKEHYNVEPLSKPKYCCFRSRVGLLKPYIDKWTEVKKASENGSSERYIAKRYLNSPYGKTAMRMDRINKIPELDDDGDVVFRNTNEVGEPVYLPYGIFVCSAARDITIRTAQKAMDVKQKDGRGSFVYADTDSVHILCDAPDGMHVHPKNLGAWKEESPPGGFRKCRYLRCKTYIHCNEDYSVVVSEKKHKDGRVEIVPEGIKCAGMPDDIKMAMINNGKTYAWDHFRIGKEFPGKKMQMRVPGGVVIYESVYKLRESCMRTGYL